MADLYDRFGRLVYCTIYLWVKESTVSEDLAQETFWRVWDRIETYDPTKGQLEPWIATIARNRATDYLRSIRGRKFLPIMGPETAAFASPSPSCQIERDNLIQVALQSLNAAQRQIIELVYFRGMTIRESAEIMQRPLPGAKSTVRTALKVLRIAADGLA